MNRKRAELRPWNDQATGDQGDRRLPLRPCRQVSGWTMLIGAMRCGVQDHPVDEAGPEREGLRQIEAEVERTELVGGGGLAPELGRAAGKLADQDGQGEDRSHDVDVKLDDIDPDDGLHSSQKRVDDGVESDGEDRRLDRPARDDLEHPPRPGTGEVHRRGPVSSGTGSRPSCGLLGRTVAEGPRMP